MTQDEAYTTKENLRKMKRRLEGLKDERKKLLQKLEWKDQSIANMRQSIKFHENKVMIVRIYPTMT